MSFPNNITNEKLLELFQEGHVRKYLAEQVKTTRKLSIGDHEFTLHVEDSVDEFYMQKAKEDLRETPEITAQGFKELKELLAEELNLPVVLTDEYLIIFLRRCKWYPHSALSLIKRVARFWKNYPHVIKEIYPSILKDVLCSGLIYPLPAYNTDGTRIFVIECGKRWKPKEISLNQLFKGVIFWVKLVLWEAKTQIAGAQLIIDMDGFSLSQVTYFNPNFAKMLSEYGQRVLPCRLKAIHIINQPYIFNMVFALFKPFLEEKFRKRIYFHGKDRATLTSMIDKSLLFEKHGGELNSNETFCEDLWNIVCALEQFFRVYENIENVDKV